MRFPRLAVLMFLSGSAALAYELVWMRMLSRTFGVTVYAVASLVALYMGGLALGAAAAPRLCRGRDGLRLYAWLEAGAGLAALAATAWLSALPGIVASFSGEGSLSVFWRLLLAAPALLPPTALLGATLPALVKAAGPAEAGWLYGANTLGALVGLTAAGFWTIGEWGERATVALAMAANLSAAGAAFALSGRRGAAGSAPAAGRRAAPRLIGIYALAGFCSMGLEVLWSRSLVFLLGNSTYAFSAVLAAYLAGVGLGSWAASRARRPPSLAAALTGTAGTALLSALSFRLMGLAMDSPSHLYSPLLAFWDIPLMAAEAFALVFPSAFAMGMAFPAAVAEAGGDESAVAGLYAANTVGGVAGSLAAGFWGTAALGGHGAYLAVCALQSAAALAASGRAPRRWPVWALAGGALALAVARDPVPEIIARRLARAQSGMVLAGHHDSPEAAVTVAERGSARYLLINGVATSENSLPGVLMQLLPNLFVEDPRSALVICLGAGNTFRTASLLGGDAVDGVELISEVVRRLPYFHPDIADHLGLPGRAAHVEDGRQFLLRSRRRYDTIVVDAAPPLYSAGTVNLYTSEFMALARDHLSEQGVFALWLPTRSFEEDYGRILRSLCDAFPHVAVWQQPGMSGVLFFGAARPFAWPKGTLERRYKARAGSLGLRGFDEAFALSGFKLSEDEVRAYAARFPPVTDDLPATEFPLRRFAAGARLERDMDFLLKAKR